jgi:hypothetical protein
LSVPNLQLREKQEEKEEKKRDYYLRECSFGSFQRAFEVPEGVDADKIEASFKKGLLTVTLPKTPEAQKAARRSRSRQADRAVDYFDDPNCAGTTQSGSACVRKQEHSTAADRPWPVAPGLVVRRVAHLESEGS